MEENTFEHVKTIYLKDPDFTSIFLNRCGARHVITLQTWCAFLVDTENLEPVRVDYPAWAWNVAASGGDGPELTIFFERQNSIVRCEIDPATGHVTVGDVIMKHFSHPSPNPPHMITEKAIWYPRDGRGHSLVASRYDRMTELTGDVSRITQTDFFIEGPDGTVYLHRWDVGLMQPHPVDQPDLVVNYRAIGCNMPMGACFDDAGKLWVLDEAGPYLFEVNLDGMEVVVHDISSLHRDANDVKDPSPYPWHSIVWSDGKLFLGCCDAARIDVIRPAGS